MCDKYNQLLKMVSPVLMCQASRVACTSYETIKKALASRTERPLNDNLEANDGQQNALREM